MVLSKVANNRILLVHLNVDIPIWLQDISVQVSMVELFLHKLSLLWGHRLLMIVMSLAATMEFMCCLRDALRRSPKDGGLFNKLTRFRCLMYKLVLVLFQACELLLALLAHSKSRPPDVRQLVRLVVDIALQIIRECGVRVGLSEEVVISHV